jgi:chaperone required for assembly of F1-ATPase
MRPPKSPESTVGSGVAQGGPKGPITDTMAKPLAKRFYKQAASSAAPPYAVMLDGRTVKTPAKRALQLPTQRLADAVAAEWNAQEAVINPSTMPLTRFANTAIDAVANNIASVASDVVAYAGRDLLSYRAESPPKLVSAQAVAWDPIIMWAEQSLGARIRVFSGIIPIDQQPEALGAIARAVERYDAFGLTTLHVITTMTGSALLALAHSSGHLTVDDAWALAHVDEDYQISLWGSDFEAEERRKRRRFEFDAACRFLELSVC